MLSYAWLSSSLRFFSLQQLGCDFRDILGLHRSIPNRFFTIQVLLKNGCDALALGPFAEQFTRPSSKAKGQAAGPPDPIGRNHCEGHPAMLRPRIVRTGRVL